MKKKGFTLIELLAVIVILAIIALIATPIVLNLINKAREGAAKASATSYIKAVETYMITSELDGGSEKLESGESYDVADLNDLVELKGTMPDSGEITIDDKRNVTSASLVISGYLVNYDGNDYTVAGRSNDVYAESIEITKPADTVIKGETLQLTANITPNSVTNNTITWKSSDEKIATVDSTGKVTGQGLGTVKITAKSVNGKSASVDIKVNDYLVNVVEKGDYVAYDAGEWDEATEKPKTQGDFGGNAANVNKGNSVSWCYKDSYTTSLKGWRVLETNTSTKTVTLVHAGQPECYYHGENKSESKTKLDERAANEYMNDYAESAHAMTYEEAYAITDSTSSTSETLRKTGDYYWLATANSDSNYSLWNVGSDGYIDYNYNRSLGFRPVIELKANMLTSGQTTDKVGNKDAWTIVAQD